MTTIWGMLNLNDDESRLVNTIGQVVVWEAVQGLLADFNAELAQARSMFVEAVTSDFKFTYKLPGSGYMQKVGSQGQPGARKEIGEWGIELPLEEFSDQIATDRVDMAYMTLQELQRHLDAVQNRSKNSMRREILLALFSNATWEFKDQTGKGNLNIKPLANGDGDLYNPPYGEENLVTDDHYFGLNYLSAAIADGATNPIPVIVDELEEHFGGTDTFGADVAVFINKAEKAKVKALPTFKDEGLNRFVSPGADVSTVTNLPAGLPGKIIGWADAWIVEWPFIPPNYLYGMHLSAPKPLRMRVDPAEMGLGSGDLELVAENETYPFKGSFYSQRYGFGVANRLNGVVAQLVASTSYDIPAGFVR